MEIVKVNGLKKEIDDEFVVKRIKYLCEKGIVLLSNDEKVKRVLDKIIMLTKSFNINSDKVKKEIENLITRIIEYKQSMEGFYSLGMYKKIKELYEMYNISNKDNLKLIMEQIDKGEKMNKAFQITRITQGNSTKISKKKEKEKDEALSVQIEKLYYQKVYEIVFQMEREIGNASDEKKINWIYNYVLNLKFATIPSGSSRRNPDGTTDYDTSLAAKKITKFGQIIPLNSVIVGEKFDGVFDKYNLIFSKEKEGLCGAKSDLVEDLCDFCLNKRNYCINISGYHMGVTHGWNAIINRNGVYHLDASNNWHGKETQYLTSESELNRKWPSYRVNSVKYNPRAFYTMTIKNVTKGNQNASGFNIVKVTRANQGDQTPSESAVFHFARRKR